MRIITYNVLDGFENAPDRKKLCLNWLEKQSPDILYLNELNHFTEKDLQDFARQIGHPYSALLMGRSSYRVGITSRFPLLDIDFHYESLLGHGAISCSCQGIKLLTTHLHPHSIQKRLEDTGFLVNKLMEYLNNGDEFIFGGDLNSFYFEEKSEYEREDNKVLEWFKIRSKANENFQNLQNGELDFSVTKNIAATSAVDLLSKFNQDFFKSTGTKLCQRKTNLMQEHQSSGIQAGAIRLRIDYIWCSPKLAERAMNCYIPQDHEVEEISDHYPIIAEFK